MSRKTRPEALPASTGSSLPAAMVVAQLSGDVAKAEMAGQEVFVARRQHGDGQRPAAVRLTSSAAVPSPPTPTRARSRPWACQALAGSAA